MTSQVLASKFSQHIVILALVCIVKVFCYSDRDPEHITAILGQSIQFNCHAHFPDDTPVPYVVTWSKKGSDLPIFIWYDDYPTHCSQEFRDMSTNSCRIDRIHQGSPGLGVASLNLTNIQESDRGWYNCKVVFMNRPPEEEQRDNGTWYHLSVHAAPHFKQVPEKIYYVNIGDSIILSCVAEGTPDPEIIWFKYDDPIQESNTVAVINDGIELRINYIRQDDLADYTCVARNGEGRTHHMTKVVIAGGAVITVPPLNTNKTEGDMVNFKCKGEGTPGNLTTSWFKGDVPVHRVPGLSDRTQVTKDGNLIISQVKAEDGGEYVCEISNGIGRPQKARATLAVEYPARVSFTPTIQYLPLHLSGVIHCHLESNPEFTFITWTKDKRIFDPFEMDGIQSLKNGSLHITKVTKAHAGDYTCTPYNIHGTTGTSGIMQVHVRDPPTIKVKPEDQYVKNVGSSVTLPCSASGVPTPSIEWRRKDGHQLPKGRHDISQGVLKIKGLVKKDHGIYQCVVTNDVATLSVETVLVVERTTPHAPHNVTVTKKDTFGVTIEWLPGYSGCSHCTQKYKIRYKEQDSRTPNWIELPVHPPEARRIQLNNLSQGTTYDFQVIGMNEYGDGMFSQIVSARTKDGYLEIGTYPMPSAVPSEQSTAPGRNCAPLVAASTTERKKLINTEEFRDCIYLNLNITPFTGYPQPPKNSDNAPAGEKPGKPESLGVEEVPGGWVISWDNPKGHDHEPVLYYTLQKKEDSQTATWVQLTDHKIEPEEASYLIKNMGTAKAYLFRVFAHSATSFTPSDEYKYPMPPNIKNRAITAGLVGGVLFFVVAIIVSVCTVKICNRRKQRKQEQALKAAAIAGTAAGTSYSMIACQPSSRNGGNINQVPLKRMKDFHKAEFQL